jgi:hypothetical protein
MNPHINIGLIEQVSAELHSMLGDEYDAETFWDTNDGISDVLDIIDHILRERTEAQSFAAAAKDTAATYSARSKRLGDKVVALNKVLGTILDAADERKVARPLGTVSRTKGHLSVSITDETAIPSQLTITTTRPDKAAIKKQLEQAEIVPGAELVRGDEGITVRVK